MRILFTVGNPYLPQRSGGAQSSTDQLAKALIAAGHEVAVACALAPGDNIALRSKITRKLSRTGFSRDTVMGYSVYRAWDPSDLSEVVRRFKPDVAVVQNGSTVPIAQSLQAAGVPIAIFFRNVEVVELKGDLDTLKDAAYIANSAFTARRMNELFGVTCTVIQPYVDGSLYRTPSTRENVTFINPYPKKGADIAFAVAERCPDIPFRFIESWHIFEDFQAELDARIAKLPNVTFQKRVSDMRTIYSKAKILLAPSLWEEAWGRVATEAHFSGIPVVGSRQGGLPEAIGPGGIIIDIDADLSRWVDAVRLLWDDDDAYARLSQASLAFSQRPEGQADFQTRQLLRVLQGIAA